MPFATGYAGMPRIDYLKKLDDAGIFIPLSSDRQLELYLHGVLLALSFKSPCRLWLCFQRA